MDLIPNSCTWCLLCILQVFLGIHFASGNVCRGLSAEVKCTCDGYGHCIKGTVEVNPWLQFALKTQRETQLDITFDHAQLLDAHNAYNNRAYGPLYGSNDTCSWPPPYETGCLGIGNHEFSIVDLLNMGIRAVELDNWYCAGAMRIAHLLTAETISCNSNHVLFSDVVEDIGNWLDQPENEGEVIRIYVNEKYDQRHDNDINGPFERYLRHDRILSPANLRDTYGGEWPTLRTMRQDGKGVVIVHGATAGTDEDYVHQGIYIHAGFWQDLQFRLFTNYPQCGGKNETNRLRFYSDSTHYILDYFDGPSNGAGVILDLMELVKCRIQFPGADQITPQFMETAVYTWARGQPSRELSDATCVMLNGNDTRWYTPDDCSKELSYACQSTKDIGDWTTSTSTGPYDVNTGACPDGYRFGLPQNGYQNQKLLESLTGGSVWLNLSPLLPSYEPPPPDDYTTPAGSAHRDVIIQPLVYFVSAVVIFIMTK